MKAIIIYKSKTGFTKKYAEWIAEALAGDVYEYSEVDLQLLSKYDTIIFGGGLYASGINGAKFISNNCKNLVGKKLIVFATGCTPGRENEIIEIKTKNFTVEEQNTIEFFYLRGGYNHSLVNLFDKCLMTLLKWRIKIKREITPDERGMLAAYDKPVDFTRKENIEPLVAYAMSTNRE